MFNDLSQASTSTRPSAVAGMFYPAQPDALMTQLTSMLVQARTDELAPKAIIAPHAGYIYSGQTAADVYARLANTRKKINTVVLLGPAHRVAFKGIAAPTVAAFATPLGKIPIDQQRIQQATQLENVGYLDQAHAEEHSLEVQLPFLQKLLGEFSLVPFVVGDATQDDVAHLLKLLWDDDSTLIVISSDLSHFLDYETAKQHDLKTANMIENFQGEQLGSHDACGYKPIGGLLKIAKEKDLSIERVSLCNSGDTAGDKNRVVGYASYALYQN